jgi:hypothetical protein
MPEPMVVPATIVSESNNDKRGLRAEFDTAGSTRLIQLIYSIN